MQRFISLPQQRQPTLDKLRAGCPPPGAGNDMPQHSAVFDGAVPPQAHRNERYAPASKTTPPAPETTSSTDIALAVRTARTHCAVQQWPQGTRCRNCGWPHPCSFARWATQTLASAGWNEADITALDNRTGPWS